MIGAINGDLIAWTYEHDIDAYNAGIISPQAQPYNHGRLLQYMASVAKTTLPTRQLFHQLVHQIEIMAEAQVPLPSEVHEYLTTGYKIIPGEVKMLIWPAAYIHSGWYAADELSAHQKAFEWHDQLHLDKIGGYSAQLAPILYRLSHGSSFDDIEKEFSALDFEFVLGKYWECLKNSSDYRSAIDNAMHTKGYRHLNGIIVGALAGAYYKNLGQ